MSYAPHYTEVVAATTAAATNTDGISLFADVKSKLIILSVFLGLGFIILLFYNTEAAIRILFAVMNFIWRLLLAVAKGIYAVFTTVTRWVKR